MISAEDQDARRILLWRLFCERAAAKGLPLLPPPADLFGYTGSEARLTSPSTPLLRGEGSLDEPLWGESGSKITASSDKHPHMKPPEPKAPLRAGEGLGVRPIALPPQSNLSSHADLGGIYQQLLHKDARRATGVYYTPPETATTIAERTLRPLLDAALLADDPVAALLALRVADLSCGSGRMLAAAVRLIAATLATADPAGRSAATWGNSALATVHGCDIDPAAVDVARYSLLLEFVPAGSAVLPEIKLAVADGLGQLPAGWGGFDAVLGNPPYVSNRAIEPRRREELRREYTTARRQYDLCVPFIEAGLRRLRDGGMLGYIVSNKFMAADYGAALRELLVDHNTLIELRDVSSDGIFSDAAIYPSILIVRKAPPSPDHLTLCSTPGATAFAMPQSHFAAHPTRLLSVAGNATATVIAAMQQAAQPIPAKLIRCGMASTGFARRLLSRDELAKSEANPPDYRPLLGAQHAGAYTVVGAEDARLLSRAEAGERRWTDFARPKILIPGISMRLRACFDSEGYALGRVYYIDSTEISIDPYLLLALLNSDLLDQYYRHYYWPAHLSGGYLRINSTYLATLPLLLPASTETEQLATQCADRVEALKRGEMSVGDVRQGLEPMVRTLYGVTSL